jgi:hypothetical protein
MSWAHQQPVIFSDEDELQLKLQFAHMCAEDPANVALHGYTLFPGEQNYGRAMAAQKWLNDPFVQREITRLTRETPENFVPDEMQIAKELIDKARSCGDPKDSLGFYKLFTDVMKYTGNNNAVQVNVIQNVIEVPTRATDDELPVLEGQWAEQQRNLIADARSSRPN